MPGNNAVLSVFPKEEKLMPRTVAIGIQDFQKIRIQDTFYIDKTNFIEEWWESRDDVTLITRPGRFGKTLTMSMVEHFFSVNCAGCGNIFEGLSIWEKEKYRQLQGSYPVISLSFSNIKETTFHETRKKICRTIQLLYRKFGFLLEGSALTDEEKEDFQKITVDMEDYVVSLSLQQLSEYLYRYYGKKAILLLDEYDTPLQEAYVNGYWNELSDFIRNLFHATFKGNPYMERAIMTGITRISKESIFSDLNNLKLVTTTSDEYADCFGFTEKEVFSALDEYQLSDKKEQVKEWYNGFTFGQESDIYNPWSILNYLDTGQLRPYWANTSSNQLIGKLLRQGSTDTKQKFEQLLSGYSLKVSIDEQIIFEQLSEKESSIWSLLLASGYLKIVKTDFCENTGGLSYYLTLTNKEVRLMFKNMIHSWFSDYDSGYNDFIKALLQNDIKAMNVYMNRVALNTFSFFDSGKKPSAENEPERFYHGFVLGLIVDLEPRYTIFSNRESGFGRYDVILEPKGNDDAIILKFKVFDPDEENTLSDTVHKALEQIEQKKYETDLLSKGFTGNRIRKYGFAFQGKTVLIVNGTT